MEKTKRQIPASLRQLRPSDVKLHVYRVQATALTKLKKTDEAKVSYFCLNYAVTLILS